MAEERKRRKKQQHQDWKPHWSLQMLQNFWMVFFSAVKIAAGALATVLLICGVCAFVFAGMLGTYLENDVIPSAGVDLDNYDLDEDSYVYYVDGNGDIQLLQALYAETSRKWVDYEDIPENLINAAVAIEDKRFFEHQGVDWITTVRACIMMFLGDDSKGGSTITQQLIKNLTQQDDVTVQRKITEIFSAIKFERRYNKEVVMEWYLNVIYMGQGCNGVKSAAATYFGKEVQMLTLAECASLISITNNPSMFDPYSTNVYSYQGVETDGAGRNRIRQAWTLGEMLDQGLITQEEYDEAMEQEMVFKSGVAEKDRLVICANESCGYWNTAENFSNDPEDADYFYCPVCGTKTTPNTNESQAVYSWFVDTVLEDVAKDLAELYGWDWNDKTKTACIQLINRSGYHIYSTLDKKVQDAVDAIYLTDEHIPDTRSGQQLQSSIVVVDNRTGDIVAMAGALGEKTVFDAWNRATDSPLQPGSSIKPLSIYAPAFELGEYTPVSIVKDLPLYYDADGDPIPNNDTMTYGYKKTIHDAITSSINAVAVQTLDQIGMSYSYDFAKNKFLLSGLTDHYVSWNGDIMSDVNLAPLGLGAPTVGVSVRDLTSAYATFTNDGVYREGRTYTRVYDSEGNLVLINEQETERILSEKAVNYMNYCLDSAVNEGTGMDGDMRGHDVAAKTGSTSDYKDRWYCGYTGYYTACVWTGYDTPEPIRLVGDYSNPAARLWKKVMQPLHEGLSRLALFDESDMPLVEVCVESGKLATEACKADIRSGHRCVRKLRVYSEDAPKEECDKHVLVDYCTLGNGVATNYCERFAKVTSVKFTERGLAKYTWKELQELKMAAEFGLEKIYLQDEYVYLVTENGKDQNFFGFDEDINEGVKAPYKVCTVHTKEAWEEYQKANTPTEPETDPINDDFTFPWEKDEEDAA